MLTRCPLSYPIWHLIPCKLYACLASSAVNRPWTLFSSTVIVDALGQSSRWFSGTTSHALDLPETEISDPPTLFVSPCILISLSSPPPFYHVGFKLRALLLPSASFSFSLSSDFVLSFVLLFRLFLQEVGGLAECRSCRSSRIRPPRKGIGALLRRR